MNDLKERIVYAIAAMTTAILFIGGAVLMLVLVAKAIWGL